MRALRVIVLIMLGTACSSPKKYTYYFDHQQVTAKTEKAPSEVVTGDTVTAGDPLPVAEVPEFYASTTVNIKPVHQPKGQVRISDPTPKKEPKTEEQKRTGFAVFGFIFSGLGAILIPYGYGIFLAIVGVSLSWLGLKSKRRLLALLGLIMGSLAILVTLVLTL